MAINPIPTLQDPNDPNQVGYSPDYIKQLREYAAGMLTAQKSPTSSWRGTQIYGPLNGADDAMKKVLGAMLMKEAREREQSQYVNQRNAGKAFTYPNTPTSPSAAPVPGGTGSAASPFQSEAPPQEREGPQQSEGQAWGPSRQFHGQPKPQITGPQTHELPNHQEDKSLTQSSEQSHNGPQSSLQSQETDPNTYLSPMDKDGNISDQLKKDTKNTVTAYLTHIGRFSGLDNIDPRELIRVASLDPKAGISSTKSAPTGNINAGSDKDRTMEAQNDMTRSDPNGTIPAEKNIEVAEDDAKTRGGVPISQYMKDAIKNGENWKGIMMLQRHPDDPDVNRAFNDAFGDTAASVRKSYNLPDPFNKAPTSAPGGRAAPGAASVPTSTKTPATVPLTPDQAARGGPATPPTEMAGRASGAPPIIGYTNNPKEAIPPFQGTINRGSVTPTPQSSIPNSMFRDQPLPSSQLQREASDAYWKMSDAWGHMMDPKVMQELINMRLGMMPQTEIDPQTGMYITREPGRPPIMTNPQTGQQIPFLPPVKGKPGSLIGYSDVPTPTGWQRQFVLPTGGVSGAGNLNPAITPPAAAPQPPAPPAPATPPVPAPGAGRPAPTVPARTAPAATPPTPAGSPVRPQVTPTTPIRPQVQPAAPGATVNTNPEEMNPFQVAGDVITMPGMTKPLTMAEAEAKTNAVANESGDWKPYYDWANGLPRVRSSYQGPDELDLAARAQRGDRGALGDLINLEDIQKAELKKAEITDTETAKEMNEVSKAISEAGMQGIKLRDSLKMVNHILDNPDFYSGKFSATVTGARKWLGEIKHFAERYQDLDGNYPFKGAFDALEKRFNVGQASPNEVFVKVVSGAILQSLRQMLGPNSGQFRVQELKMLEQAFGNPDLSLEGNKIVMSMIDKLNDRSIIYSKMANEYKSTHGGVDPNFIKAMDLYAEHHPVYTADFYDPALGGINPKYLNPNNTNPQMGPDQGWVVRPSGVKIRPRPGGP